MATFHNVATLSFTGGSVRSNLVNGEVLEALSGSKFALNPTYRLGSVITYVVTLKNASASAMDGLTLYDNLGLDIYGGKYRVPLEYVPDTAAVVVNGSRISGVTVEAGPPMKITGICIPAGGNAVICYEALVGGAAPMKTGSSIKNVVRVTGCTLSTDLLLNHEIPVSEKPILEIEKELSPTVVQEDKKLTYTFRIKNYGNVKTKPEDNVVLTDVFRPKLQNEKVTCNGVNWVRDTNYTYTGGVFTSGTNQIEVPAATFTRDPGGQVQVVPGVVTIKVKGTI